ncbi:MAG: sensor histidine kinase [Myxococcota bacterium]
MNSETQNPYPGGLLVVGTAGEILQAPDFFTETLDVDSRVAPSIYHLFDPDDPPYLSFSKIVRRSNGVVEYHLAVHGSLGGSKGFRYWTLPAVEKGKSVSATAFYLTDESVVIQSHEWERRRLRRAILDDVQDTISDYVNHNLTGIRAMAEVLRDVPDAAEETGERIVAAVDELRGSVNQMADLAASSTNRIEANSPVQLAELSDVLGGWAKGRISIDCRVKDVSDDAMMSTDMLERILLPLVDNAIEATRGSDPVLIRVEQLGIARARITIRDHGLGMNEKTLDRCVDPFYTTKPGHLGLGLTRAANFLQKIGGEWAFESRPGKGTKVTVEIPLKSLEEFL